MLEDAERLCQDRNDKRAAGASPWLRALRMPRGAVAPSQDEERGQTVKKQAIMVTGDSLKFIEDDPELIEKFLQITDNADVVLGCRVSPK